MIDKSFIWYYNNIRWLQQILLVSWLYKITSELVKHFLSSNENEEISIYICFINYIWLELCICLSSSIECALIYYKTREHIKKEKFALISLSFLFLPFEWQYSITLHTQRLTSEKSSNQHMATTNDDGVNIDHRICFKRFNKFIYI
jgi:hypothetical protein